MLEGQGWDWGFGFPNDFAFGLLQQQVASLLSVLYQTPQSFGALCDGVHDDSLFLAQADRTGQPLALRGGTMRIAQNMSMASPLFVSIGAEILVDGVTLALLPSSGFFPQGYSCIKCINGGKFMLADGLVDEVDPRWWGFAQNASAAVNDAAIQGARDSITTRGTVRFPAGAFAVSAYTPINRSFIRFRGASAFGTTLMPVAGAADVTGIDGTMQPGFVQGSSAYIDRCSHDDISVFRADSQSAVVTLSSERLPLGIPTGSRGFIHRYASNASIRTVLQGSPIDYYEAETTGASVDVQTVRTPLPGDTTATLRFGLVSDCTIAGLSGTSSNGSSYKSLIDNTTQSVTAETWAAFVYGSDLRDHFWLNLETAGGSHAVDYVNPNGSAAQVWDIHMRSVVLDAWKQTGFRIAGLPGGSRVQVSEGYSAPIATGSGPSVDIIGSSGVALGEDFEAKGGNDYASHIGVQLRSGSARCTVRAAVTGCASGVVVDAGAFNIIAPSVEGLSGQPVTAAITLQNGSSRNLVEGYRVSGDMPSGGVTDGVVIDASSSYNTVGAGILAVGSITGANIRISGTAITTAGTINHNKVTDGAIPPT